MTVQISDFSRFSELGLLNDRGLPRLNVAQFYFRSGIDLELLTDLYRYWRDTAEYGLIEKSWIDGFTIKHEYKAVKCAKRGNDVYQFRVKERIGWMENIPNLKFFSEKQVKNGSARTKMLFFTLTYDTNRCSRIEAWENVGIEYNRWISRVRGKYGRVSVFRVWQSMENGYPHIHGVALFRDKEFPVFMDKKGSYRVQEKEDLETSWHSFVDVAAVQTVRGALCYCKRYITRNNLKSEANARTIQENGSVSDLDNALMWIFSKRGFAISGDFREAYKDVLDLMRCKHNSNGKIAQSCLDGSVLLEKECWYRWLGVFRGSELGVSSNKWVHVLDKLPDGFEDLDRGISARQNLGSIDE